MNVSKTSGSTCSSSRKLVILPVFVVIAAAVIVLELRVIVSVIRSINLLKGFKPFMWELGELQHDIRLQLICHVLPTIFDYLENARKFLAELTTLFGKWFYNNHFYYYLLQNFLALCASNYYDNCIFHRWVGRNSQKRYTCMYVLTRTKPGLGKIIWNTHLLIFYCSANWKLKMHWPVLCKSQQSN